MARLKPLPPKEWPPEMQGAIAALRPPAPRHPFPERDPGRPKALNALGTLAKHPALTTAFHTFNGHILFASTLSPRQREILVLRVAALRQSDYEWAQHVVLAGDAGLTASEIQAIMDGRPADSTDRLLVAAADELIEDACITDDTWAALAEQLDERQLMDLVFTVGAYEALAMAFKSFGVELDGDLIGGT